MQIKNNFMLDQSLKWYRVDEKREFGENQMFDEKRWTDE